MVIGTQIRRRYSEGEIRAAVAFVDAGFSWREASDRFDIELSSLHRRARRLDIGRRGHRAAANEQHVQLPTAVVDLVYLAALIDCEGYVGIYEGTRDAVSVGVTNTDEPVIRWLESMGGTVHERNIEGRKRCWTWALQGRRDVLALLEAISPYMRMKRDKAVEAMCFLRDRGVVSL